eukprot:822883-Pyramimonas_sp.AAC.1
MVRGCRGPFRLHYNRKQAMYVLSSATCAARSSTCTALSSVRAQHRPLSPFSTRTIAFPMPGMGALRHTSRRGSKQTTPDLE